MKRLLLTLPGLLVLPLAGCRTAPAASRPPPATVPAASPATPAPAPLAPAPQAAQMAVGEIEPASRAARIGGGILEHVASGMKFPVTVAGFNRVGFRQYDEDGHNVSAGYDSVSPSTPAVITVYVFPSPKGPADAIEAKRQAGRSEFNRAKADILEVREGAKVLDEQEIPGPVFAPQHPGYFARFMYTGNFGGKEQPLESLLYVYSFVGGGWTIKYRITYPTTSGGARLLVNRFVQELEWTIPPAGTPAASGD